MTADEVRTKLLTEIDEDAVTLLENAKMLRENRLKGATVAMLTDQVGLALGDALAVKEMFPCDAPATPPAQTPPAVTTPAAPPVVNVTVTDTDITKMGEAELLNKLRDNGEDEEVYDELTLREKYNAATRAGRNGECIAIDDSGKINTPNTLGYWRHLRKPLTTARRSYKGCRIVTLDRALGRLDRMMWHPFFANEVITEGFDSKDQDWRKVDRTRWEGFFWARTTEHENWTGDVNMFDAYKLITATELPEQYAAIMDDWAFEQEAGTVVNLNAGGASRKAGNFRDSDDDTIGTVY